MAAALPRLDPGTPALALTDAPPPHRCVPPQMLNWDWLRNRPAEPPSPDVLLEPGWWVNVRQLLRPPLLDHQQPEEGLGAWIDQHTMRVHGALLDRLHLLRRDEATQQLVLNDPYWQQMQAMAAGAAPGGSQAAPEAVAAEAETAEAVAAAPAAVAT